MNAKIQAAFENFMNDAAAVEAAIDSSTSASYSGSGYSVELFEDGTWRVLWDNAIGNLYDSPGVIVSIPKLSDDEIAPTDDDGNELSGAFYDNAIEALREAFEYVVSER